MESLAIVVLSFLGLIISFYLLYGQKAKRKVVCLIGHDCDAVVKSAYGKTFGLENTVLGILFYGGILVIRAFSLPIPQLTLTIVAGLAGLFSIYLIYVQGVILKKWCDYCILSALINWALFAIFAFRL